MSHSTELAVCGFRSQRRYSPEKAGLQYEVRLIRDRLLFHEDCSTILGASWINIKKSDSLPGFELVISRNSSSANLNNGAGGGGGGGGGADDDSSLYSEDETSFDKEDKAYEKYLKNLDPTQYKDQDHYKVLGLSKLRYKCTENQIKLAYKKKVLNHHPDKRRQKGVAVKGTEEDYFTCISKAYETLCNGQKRRAYDSVDPTFDDTIPSGTLTFKENFFKLYAPAFERNERWSNIQPCPKLGDLNTTEDAVNRFYNFWYDFDSWREFSYLDEEDKEKGENRLERRWIDKQNKAARDKRRKDELKRIRTLVDSSHKNDPRVQRFKEEEKKRREEERLAREEERRTKLEAVEREKREMHERAQQERLKLEEEERQRAINEKREKEQLKKMLQKERKSIRETCQKYNYFCDATEDVKVLTNTDELNKICRLFSLERLKSMNDRLTSAENQYSTNRELLRQKLSSIFYEFVSELDELLENERKRHLLVSSQGQKENGEDELPVEWTTEENQLLIKAVTIFPVGTKSRWDVIASFINEHFKLDGSASKRKTGKDVVAKVKDVQKLDEKSKESVSKGVPLLQVKSNMKVETAPSIRTDSPADAGWEHNPWTAQEQKLLEQALKTYPADDPDRWDKVAACLPGRNKKECVKRYKELAELVRARKLALQQQQKQKKDNLAAT